MTGRKRGGGPIDEKQVDHEREGGGESVKDATSDTGNEDDQLKSLGENRYCL